MMKNFSSIIPIDPKAKVKASPDKAVAKMNRLPMRTKDNHLYFAIRLLAEKPEEEISESEKNTEEGNKYSNSYQSVGIAKINQISKMPGQKASAVAEYNIEAIGDSGAK